MNKWERNPTRDDPVQVNLSEADLAFIEHALAVTIIWTKQDGDKLLGERYNDIREELIDAHIDWLEERGGYDD